MITNDHKPPQTNTISHKPPANDHPQKSTIDHELSANDHKLPANDHKSPANDHKPPPIPKTTTERPQTTNKQPNRSFLNSNYLIFLQVENEAEKMKINIGI